MRAIETVSTEWIAVDEKVFNSKQECLEYERSMRRESYFTLAYPSMIPQGQEAEKIKMYAYGYSTETSTTEYQPASFLREAGEIVSWQSDDTILEYVMGNWENVLPYILNNERFWNKRGSGFIRAVNFTDLTDHSNL